MTPQEWAFYFLVVVLTWILAIHEPTEDAEIAIHEPIPEDADVSSSSDSSDVVTWKPSWTPLDNPPAPTKCPREMYELKHYCSWCRTTEDSFKFSKEARDTGTAYNTVIHPPTELDGRIGELTYETLVKDTLCRNVELTRIDECDLLVTKKCVTRGYMCLALHATDTGHLLYKKTECFGFWGELLSYVPFWEK